MEFSEEELKIIYTVLNISIQAVEIKKGHKSKNDIIALEHMNKLVKKNDNYIKEK